MAMPKKGARKIVVDNVAYRWRIRSEGSGEHNVTVVVEEVTDSGSVCTLVVDTSVPYVDYWLTGEFQTVIAPAAIAKYIRMGLEKGWKPLQKGKPFVMVVDEEVATAIQNTTI